MRPRPWTRLAIPFVATLGVLGFMSAAAADLRAQPAEPPDSVFARQHYAKWTARIPMRDGARLFTVVYVPRDASPGRRYPILLTRTPFPVAPYDETAYPPALGPDRYMLRDGYVFAFQEVRGRYLSEGDFENVRPLLPDSVKARNPRATDEATDAYDTIEWLLHHVQDNNGRVGLLGVSYGGYYAGLASVSGHPAIAAASLQGPVADFYFEDFHHNGALTLASFHAYPVFGVPRGAPSRSHWWLDAYQKVADYGMADDYFSLLGLGPLRTITDRYYGEHVWWREMVAHPNYDDFWRARALPARLRGVTHPTLVVGGWFDAENLWGTLAVYRALRAQNPRAAVSLVMGPFGHRGWAARDVTHSVHGNLYFGDSLETRFQREAEAPFFRAHLKGSGEAPSGALVFDTGRKGWTRLAEWPSASAVRRDYFLHADATLSVAPPNERSAFVEYASDPRRPVPARCAGPTIEDGTLYHYMSDDQRCFTSRPDVAVFQTDTLREDVTFAGELTARLTVSTSGTDADFVVKLIDVYPPEEPGHPYQRDTTIRLGGYQQLVRGEIMRGRFRRSFSAPAPFRPDQAAEVVVRLPDVFHTFRKGHRIMVHVQSSWFPLFDRNPQRYVPSIYEAESGDFVAATQRLWVGRSASSRLQAMILP
jgi:uncharacterized protein